MAFNSSLYSFGARGLIKPFVLGILFILGFIFIFLSFFFRAEFVSLEQKLKNRFGLVKAKQISTDHNALVVQGEPKEQTLAERRRELLKDLDFLESFKPKWIVLEDWLDESSQSEPQTILENLQRNWETISNVLPKKRRHFAEPFEKILSDTRAELVLDHSLAVQMAEAGNVLLPLGFAAQSSDGTLAELGVTGTARFGFGFRVPTGPFNPNGLHQSYFLNRRPLDRFLSVAGDLGGVEQGNVSGALGHAFFKINEKWVSALGIQAAVRSLGGSYSDFKFFWKNGALSSFEAKGLRAALDQDGSVLLPSHALVPRLDKVIINDLLKLKNESAQTFIKGKIIFFRPNPLYLSETKQFDQQHELFSAFKAGMLRVTSGQAAIPWLWLVFGSLIILVGVLSRAWFVGVNCVLLPLFAFWNWNSAYSLLAFITCLIGFLVLSFVIFEVKEQVKKNEKFFWLKGFLKNPAHQPWNILQPQTAGQYLQGVYFTTNLNAADSKQIDRWMEEHSVFFDREERRGLGFFVPKKKDEQSALDAVWKFHEIFPDASIAASWGDCHFAPRLWFDSPSWTLEGNPKNWTLMAAAICRPGSFVIGEDLYQTVRSKVQVQMLDAVPTTKEGRPERLFNVLNLHSDRAES